MESIESYNNISLKPLTGLSLGSQPASPRQADKIKNKMSKISSADSLLTMIRNLASSKMSISSPSSPQLSDNGDMASSGKTILNFLIEFYFLYFKTCLISYIISYSLIMIFLESFTVYCLKNVYSIYV